MVFHKKIDATRQVYIFFMKVIDFKTYMYVTWASRSQIYRPAMAEFLFGKTSRFWTLYKMYNG